MTDPISRLRQIADASGDSLGLVTVEAGDLRALVAEHRCTDERHPDPIGTAQERELIEELVSKAYGRGWNEGCETMLDANEIDGAIMYPHKDARNEGCGTYMNEVRAALSLQRRV